jgi:cell division protein FtsI (penicillin-binding protein 3)
MKSRIVIFLAGLCLCLLGIVIRLVYLQVLPNPVLERLKKSQYMTVVQIPPQRGKILDRKGEELATSVTAQSLYADATLVVNPRKLARKLAPLLEIKERDIFYSLNSERRFVWIKRLLDQDIAAEIKSWNVAGLKFVEESRRAYPNQNLVSQVLGFVGTEGNGLEGLEKKYDDELKGEKQSILSRRDARGRPLVVSGQLFEYQGDGATLETTIDKDIQYELERELQKAVTDQMADKATGVIMDPVTGEVLAMGSYPSFDPIKVTRANADARRNRAVTDIYEPGSTFKVVTIAAALRSGKILPNTKFFCENGKFKVGKYTIHEATSADNFEWLTLAEILEKSSNIGTTKVAFALGQDPLKQMINDFGFGAKTGIDFPGEASGILSKGNWPDIVLSNVSFGHGIGVSAIQMASAYSAIANGGKLMKPVLVKKVGEEEFHPKMIRQVLSTKEASLLTMMLSGVTEQGGTGVLARIDGYPVAGKTGTAQKVNPNGRGYLAKSYVSSFIGFVPANNPQFTIYVVVDNPRRQFYGAQVAAPIFNRLASFALHQRGFMPIVISANGPASNQLEPPLEKLSWVSKLAKENLHSEPELNSGVPKLTGLTMREVSQALGKNKNSDNTDVEFVGTGLASEQWPPPGKAWGKKLRVVFRPQD